MSFNWRERDDETVEYHFNPRLSVPDILELLQAHSEKSASVIELIGGNLDLRYGNRPKQTLDIHSARNESLGSPAPCLIFIHGGYWRMSDKKDVAFIAEPLTEDGVTVASINYDLCPDVNLDIIVEEIREAVVFLCKNAEKFSIDANRLFISGHSAGGHLTGMMLKQNWESYGLPSELFKGGIPLSPIFEPEVVMRTSINEDVRLTLDMARRNDVLSAPPLTSGQILSVAGALEPEGWRQQSLLYTDLCTKSGIKANYLEVPDCHHFSVLDAFANKSNTLYQEVFSIISS